MDERPLLDGPRLLGRYVLHGEIAAGGMAVVHFGRLLGPVGFSRTVAIKRLHAHLARDPGFRAMFLDEARLAARIRHPNVVPTLDVLEEGHDLFLVMDYVHGESLDRLLRNTLRRGDGMSASIASGIVRDVLYGLHAAHEATSERGKPLGIVHRDVSPQNVLVGVDGLARVLDFGVAKAQARMQLTAQGQLKGKIAYMAPEQVDQADLDRRADVWSASVVLWEALTGKRLFVGDHPAQLMKKVLSQPIPPPREVAPYVPPDLEAVVLRGLEREREARFETARAMALAIEATGAAAPHHQIGTFVQEVAGDSLRKRAVKLAEIESSATASGAAIAVRSSASTVEPPEALAAAPLGSSAMAVGAHVVTPSEALVALPPGVTNDMAETDTRVSTAVADAQTLVATSLTNAKTQAIHRARSDGGSAKRWLVLVAVAAVAAAGGASATLLLRRPSPPPRASVAAQTVPSPQPPAASPQPPSYIATPSSIPTTPPSIPSEMAAPDASLPATHPPKSPSRPMAPPRKPAAVDRSDCNPPFTVDKYGVQVPKLHCL